jgi:hypothetical protein
MDIKTEEKRIAADILIAAMRNTNPALNTANEEMTIKDAQNIARAFEIILAAVRNPSEPPAS